MKSSKPSSKVLASVQRFNFSLSFRIWHFLSYLALAEFFNLHCLFVSYKIFEGFHILRKRPYLTFYAGITYLRPFTIMSNSISYPQIEMDSSQVEPNSRTQTQLSLKGAKLEFDYYT